MGKKSANALAQPDTATTAQPAPAPAPAPAKAKKNLTLSERLEAVRPLFPAPPDFHEILQDIAKAVEGK